MSGKQWRSMGAAFLAIAISASSARAIATQQDMTVMARTVGFIVGMPEGVLDVMVIYDPTNSASKADADTAMAALTSTRTNKISFRPTLTPVNSIGSAKLAFVADGVGAYSSIGAASAAKGILTFTKDPACVEAMQCAVYLTAKPTVEIKVSQTALQASKFEMAAALKMMVKEVK